MLPEGDSRDQLSAIELPEVKEAHIANELGIALHAILASERAHFLQVT
jgi:hypothetical protein